MKHLTLLIIFLFPLCLSASEKNYIPWSRISHKERKEVKSLSIRFFDAFNKNEFHKIREIIPENEISYRGHLWMSIPHFSYIISKIREKGKLNYRTIYVFSFDDCNRDSFLKKEAVKHFKVFDNNCLLAITRTGKAENPEDSSHASLIFQKNNKTGNWKIISISGFNTELEKQKFDNPVLKEKGWRTDTIHQLDLTLLIPPEFSYRSNQGNLMEYYYKENQQRKGAIQVMATKNSKTLLKNSREWIAAFLNNRRFTTVRIKFLPIGYRFDFEILDRDGKKNKIVIAALKNGRYSIFVVFIGYLDLYKKLHQRIDFTVNNLSIE